MKQTKLQNYILIHAHLVINERKEYLDGMLVVRNGRIIDLQPQSHAIKEEYRDLPVLDVRGNVILPSDFTPLLPYRPDLTEADLFAQGIGSYELYIENDIPYPRAEGKIYSLQRDRFEVVRERDPGVSFKRKCLCYSDRSKGSGTFASADDPGFREKDPFHGF